jgi:hypothetical protein
MAITKTIYGVSRFSYGVRGKLNSQLGRRTSAPEHRIVFEYAWHCGRIATHGEHSNRRGTGAAIFWLHKWRPMPKIYTCRKASGTKITNHRLVSKRHVWKSIMWPISQCSSCSMKLGTRCTKLLWWPWFRIRSSTIIAAPHLNTQNKIKTAIYFIVPQRNERNGTAYYLWTHFFYSIVFGFAVYRSNAKTINQKVWVIT